MRHDTTEKWGLGREQLPAINARLIVIRVPGFRQTMTCSRQAGFGAIGEAMGGLRYSTPPENMRCAPRPEERRP
jgi:formyl-CoA transferase